AARPRGRRLARRRARLHPGLAPVVGTLDDLAEPVAGLRGVNAIGVGRRSLEVIHRPAGKMWTLDVPILPLAVGGKNERAFAGAHQQPYRAHSQIISRSCSTGLGLKGSPTRSSQAGRVAKPLGVPRQ